MSFLGLGEPITDVTTSPTGQEVFSNMAGDSQSNASASEEVEVNNDQQFQDDETGQEEQDNSTEEEVEVEDNSTTDEKLAGKFKSVDDLVKGYKNLEKAFHQSRQPQQQQQNNSQQPVKSQQEVSDAIFQAMTEDPASVIQYFVQQALAPIQQEKADMQLQNNLQELSKDYSEISDEKGLTDMFIKAKEIAFELGNPNLSESKRILKMACQELYPKSTSKLVKQVKNETQKEILENMKSKQSVNTNNNMKQSKQNNGSKTPEELIIEGIFNAGRKNIF